MSGRSDLYIQYNTRELKKETQKCKPLLAPALRNCLRIDELKRLINERSLVIQSELNKPVQILVQIPVPVPVVQPHQFH